MMKIIVICFGTAALLAGCSSNKMEEEPPRIVQRDPSIPIRLAGTQIPADSKEKYRKASVIETYRKGVYLDPDNPDIRGEPHNVIVLTEPEVWNLTPVPEAQLPINREIYEKKAHFYEPYIAEIQLNLKKYEVESQKIKAQIEQIKKNKTVGDENTLEIDKLYKRVDNMNNDAKELKLLLNSLQSKVDALNQKENNKSLMPSFIDTNKEEPIIDNNLHSNNAETGLNDNKKGGIDMKNKKPVSKFKETKPPYEQSNN